MIFQVKRSREKSSVFHKMFCKLDVSLRRKSIVTLALRETVVRLS